MNQTNIGLNPKGGTQLSDVFTACRAVSCAVVFVASVLSVNVFAATPTDVGDAVQHVTKAHCKKGKHHHCKCNKEQPKVDVAEQMDSVTVPDADKEPAV